MLLMPLSIRIFSMYQEYIKQKRLKSCNFYENDQDGHNFFKVFRLRFKPSYESKRILTEMPIPIENGLP